MDKIRRNERMSAMIKILADAPNRIFTLSHFCDLFGAAKSTMSEDIDILRDVIKEFERRGVRDKYHIMVGGAPVSQAFADEVHADCYTKDAASAAEYAKNYLEKKKAS